MTLIFCAELRKLVREFLGAYTSKEVQLLAKFCWEEREWAYWFFGVKDQVAILGYLGLLTERLASLETAAA